MFDGVIIERVAAGQPAAVRRDLKSLFSPKADQVLRFFVQGSLASKETLENPARLRENRPVIAGMDWVDGKQAAWLR